MAGPKKIVLFDIDHTLFDTKKYLDSCFRELFNNANATDIDTFLLSCHEIYKDLRTARPFKVHDFLDTLIRKSLLSGEINELEKIFKDEKILKTAIFADVETELRYLSSLPDVVLGIFSTGHQPRQQEKIASLVAFLTNEHIYINDVDKSLDIDRIIARYLHDQIFVVDDLGKVLYSFKSKKEAVTTILIKRDGWTDRKSFETFEPDYSIKSLSELRTII